VILVACILIAGVFVMWAWDKFSASPTVVNVETTNYPLYKLHFPAVTICPAISVKRTTGEELLARYQSQVRKPVLNYHLASAGGTQVVLKHCHFPLSTVSSH
jgi:hypothetical protein